MRLPRSSDNKDLFSDPGHVGTWGPRLYTLREQFDAVLASLRPRDQVVLRGRLGYDVEPQTLDELGRQLGVSRERARQLESRAFRRLREEVSLITELESRLTLLFAGRTEPLYLDLLAIEDDVFEGFEDHLAFLGRIIEEFSTSFHVWELSGRLISTRITKESWTELVKAALVALEQQVAAQLTERDVALLIESLAASRNAAELGTQLHAALQGSLHFAVLYGGGEKVLVRIGRSLKGVVAAIMAESPSPLSLAEITAQAQMRTGLVMDEYSYRNALREIGAHVFAGRRYGLEQHIPLTQESLAELTRLAEELVLHGQTGRQWHCAQLLEAIRDVSPQFSASVDPYILNIALSQSKSLEYLGRMVWRAGNTKRRATSDRHEIADLCVAILERAGRPLTTEELQQEVSSLRGLNTNFMPQPNSRMARLRSGVWGLVERDFQSGSRTHKELLTRLEEVLRNNERALHVSELDAWVQLPQGLPPDAILGLAQLDQRFRVGRGQLIGLASWSSLRRPTVRGAIRLAVGQRRSLGDATGIYNQVEMLVERPVPRSTIHAEFRDLGYEYNVSRNEWILRS